MCYFCQLENTSFVQSAWSYFNCTYKLQKNSTDLRKMKQDNNNIGVQFTTDAMLILLIITQLNHKHMGYKQLLNDR